MIASSPTAKLAAVSAALVLHGVALFGLSGRESVEVEAGAGSVEVAFGSSFADMAAGTLEAKPAETTLEPVTPEQPSEPLDTAGPTILQPTEPTLLEPVAPERPVFAKAPKTAQPTEIDQSRLVLKSTAPATVQAALPVEMAAISPAKTQSDQVAAAPPVEKIEAVEETPTAVARSLRPKTRSKAFEQEHKSKPVQRTAKTKPKETTKKTPARTQKKATAQPKGNASKSAKAGSATGTKSAKSTAKSSGQGTKKTAKGNAKASNYPGQVMRKISRVRKPRVGQKGSAVVAFTIAPSGGLSAVSITRSSGSSQLDRAALNVVRKAAPFPPPPAGARRSFSIKIKGG